MHWIGRAGLVGRGLLHILVGWLALRIARGDQSEHADQRGALALVVRQPLGRVLVLLLAVLFAGYAAWRVAAAVGRDGERSLVQRLSFLGRGVLYAAFSAVALSFVARGPSESKSSSSPEQHDLTVRLLGVQGGRIIVAALGVGVVAVGLAQGYRAVTGRFAEDLKEYEMSRSARAWTKGFGVVGSFARMVAFALCGGFLVKAAVTYDAAEPVGLDASLRTLAARDHGPAALAIVAVGLVAYGLFAASLARYERVMGS